SSSKWFSHSTRVGGTASAALVPANVASRATTIPTRRLPVLNRALIRGWPIISASLSWILGEPLAASSRARDPRGARRLSGRGSLCPRRDEGQGAARWAGTPFRSKRGTPRFDVSLFRRWWDHWHAGNLEVAKQASRAPTRPRKTSRQCSSNRG